MSDFMNYYGAVGRRAKYSRLILHKDDPATVLVELVVGFLHH